MTNQYNCVLSPYINIKYDFSYLSTEIKKNIIILSKWFPYPPFLCPIVGIISQCFSVCSIGKLKWKFFFKLQTFLKKIQFGKFFCRKLSFLPYFYVKFWINFVYLIWSRIHVHTDTRIHFAYMHAVFILRIVYHIRYIVNYKQKQVFSVNTFTKHLHPIARENNVSVLVSKKKFFYKTCQYTREKITSIKQFIRPYLNK